MSQDPPTHYPHADTMMTLELKAVLNDIIESLITIMLLCHGGAGSQFEIIPEPRKLFLRLIIMIINIIVFFTTNMKPAEACGAELQLKNVNVLPRLCSR